MSEIPAAETHAMPGRPVEPAKTPGWSQSIEFRDGTVMEGTQTLDQQWRRIAQFPIPDDLSGKRVLDAQYVPKILAVMMTAGFYNESGLWSFTAGLPAKTGVGGGIVAIAPGRMAVVGFSPRVNDAGNSVRSMKAIEYISNELGLNVFGSGR